MAPHATDGFEGPGFSSIDGISSGSIDSYIETPQNGNQEPIAIIGMGCRLPGECSSSSKLWELIKDGKSAQERFPPERFSIDGFYHANGDRPGSLNTEGGYFIKENIRGFENSFFGINNLEATYMDPQQRKLLEVVFECFESSGLTLEQVSGANIGCYVGNFVTDFITMQLKDAEYTHRYSATGLGTTILANRISHVFNMQGPSFVIDTACSSSLYCLHSACTALRLGECDSAIVAGANLIQSPEQQLATMRAGVLSKTSTCHTFDVSADGYGRGDGIGALLVKRLSDAIRDGDPIRSVIRGTAVNSNGKTNGITLPSSDGQEAVIRKAYEQAGLGYDETDYVECHGTGTAVGDPIELEAVSRVFKRPKGSPLLVGSVKTNFGHSEAASGITSIIKVVLALEKGEIPPTIGVKEINPKIKIDDWNIKIVQEMTKWPLHRTHKSGKHLRRAGVNSFGYGGANAHAILDAPEMHVPEGYMRPSEVPVLSKTRMIFPFSASNATALSNRISALSEVDLDESSVVDLAYTLAVRRSHLSERGYVLANPQSLKNDLVPGKLKTLGSPSLRLPLAFVFTGQGAQWPGMGHELMDEFPSFRHTIRRMDATLQLLSHPPDWTIEDALREPAKTSKINHASQSQPICTAIQVALVELLSSWGIRPEHVLGHSSGEIGAAYAAGFLTAEQAITIAYYRGYTVTKSSLVGAMMAAGLGAEDAQKTINELQLGTKIRVACVNSPESVTISGDSDGIDQLKAHFDTLGTFARVLKTDGKAYHSHHMAVIGEEYESLLTSALGSEMFPPPKTGVTFISSVTNEVIDHPLGPSYWRANLESAVLFSGAVKRLIESNTTHLVEIGPHSALQMPIKQVRTSLNINESKVQYSSVLYRGKNSIDTALSLAGDLFICGHNISFANINSADPRKQRNKASEREGKMLLDLPNYTWNYDSVMFHEPRVSVEWRNRQHPHHDLLGSIVHGGDGIISTWRNVFKVKDCAWIAGHKLDQTVVFPAAGYVAMAIEAICQVTNATGPTLRLQDIEITKALPLSQEDNDAGVELFTTLQPSQRSGTSDSMWYRFNISSYSGSEGTTHARGLIRLDNETQVMERNVPADPSITESTAPRTWYQKFTATGLNFQEQFQSLTQINSDRKKQQMQIVAKTALRQGGGTGVTAESTYMIHPVTIDAILQAGIIASTSGAVRELRSKVPVHIEEIVIRDPSGLATEQSISAVSRPVGFGTINISAELHDSDGRASLQISRCRLVSYDSGVPQEATSDRHPMLRVMWKPDIERIGPSQVDYFSSYVKAYIENTANGYDQGIVRQGAILDLLAHKNPRLRILTLSSDMDEYLTDLLRLDTAFKRCRSCHRGIHAEDGKLRFENLGETESTTSQSLASGQAFDVIILNSLDDTTDLSVYQDFLSESTVLICDGKSTTAKSLQSRRYQTMQTRLGGEREAILARPSKVALSNGTAAVTNGTSTHSVTNGTSAARSILIVGRTHNHVLNKTLIEKVRTTMEHSVEFVTLEQLTQSHMEKYNTLITTIELEGPILSNISAEQWESVKLMTDHSTTLLWVTGGDLFRGSKPELGVVFGLSRALMLEQPSLRFTVVDVSPETIRADETAQQLVQVLHESFDNPDCDFEYVQHDGLLHVSRFVPEETMNKVFREKQRAEATTVPLNQATPCRLGSSTPGQPGSVFFHRRNGGTADEKPLAVGDVEISVMAVGLNSQDLRAFNGDADREGASCTSQYTGVVVKTGAEVDSLVTGDRVLVMAPGHFATHEQVPAWACAKLADNEDFQSMSRIPVRLSTALYAVKDCARLQKDESVLICCGSPDGADLVAIRVARTAGARVFAVTSTNDDAERLVNEGIISRDRVFVAAENQGIISRLLEATNGQGVDAILNFNDAVPFSGIGLVCADYSRLVQVGKAKTIASLAMDPAIASRNVSFATFDMSSMIVLQTAAGKSLRQRLLADSIALHRQTNVYSNRSHQAFEISDISDAYRALASSTKHTDIVVSLENERSPIPFLPSKWNTSFSADKTYLMIGCLGGLGRSMSKWMLARGARKFVFMGRSGTDKAPARRLVDDLTASGAQITVVRGDVVNYSDVETAVAGIDGSVGGVVQAAMGLDEALFTTMPREYWLTGLRPKIQGSWNLHNAIKGKDHELEFFLMTSSVSGSVGTATESNYCSANYFLDVFARYRRGLGLPATSVGLGMISEVGYLHENPEIEAILLRKGIQAINEDEMLQIIDTALSTSTEIPGGTDEFAQGHVLTGLEPLGLKELRKKGFEGTSPVLFDPRASLISAALDDSPEAGGRATSGLPEEVAQALESGGSIEGAVLKMVAAKFSNLVLIPANELNLVKPIRDVGVDSMLGAEFRGWIYQTFKVDVPYLTILSATATLTMLSELIAEKLVEGKDA